MRIFATGRFGRWAFLLTFRSDSVGSPKSASVKNKRPVRYDRVGERR
jgi:hypothetical protein